jgi:hypothetical protein
MAQGLQLRAAKCRPIALEVIIAWSPVSLGSITLSIWPIRQVQSITCEREGDATVLPLSVTRLAPNSHQLK